MTITRRRFGAASLALAAMALVAGGQPALAEPLPRLEAVPGRPFLMLASYDLGELGYAVEEWFVSGTASSFSLPDGPTADGRWRAEPDDTAPYVTRMVVVRPTDPARFNGSLLVEWLNVSGGLDTPATWLVGHREMLRSGHVWVGVSMQKVGVEGGPSVMGQQGFPLKKVNPGRYGRLSHPGDAFSFDMFTQAGRLLKASHGGALLGGLRPARMVAIGESQSAAFLTTYVNAIDPLARVYDGFFVHSRFGSSAAIDGSPMRGGAANYPDHVRFRPDLRVPVLCVITETDLLGARLAGYHASRRRDDARLRVWELPGAAHADNYLFGGAMIDSGKLPVAELARVFLPTTQSQSGNSSVPFNPGMVHHYVVNAAIAGLDRWLRTGRPPASVPPMRLASGGTPGVKPEVRRDANGIAMGGLRTPWVDVPTIALSGVGDPANFTSMLAGSGIPFDAERLARLYPGGREDYLRRFTRALDRAIRAGHLMAADREEILAIAALNYGVMAAPDRPATGLTGTPG